MGVLTLPVPEELDMSDATFSRPTSIVSAGWTGSVSQHALHDLSLTPAGRAARGQSAMTTPPLDTAYRQLTGLRPSPTSGGVVRHRSRVTRAVAARH